MVLSKNKEFKLHENFHEVFKVLAKSYEEKFLDLAKEELGKKYKVKRVAKLNKVKYFEGFPELKEPHIYFTVDNLVVAVSFHIYSNVEMFWLIHVKNVNTGAYISKCANDLDIEKLLKNKKVKEIKNA